MKSFIVTSSEAGQTLEKYVKKVLKVAPLNFIYKLFRKKDVKVNGHWEKEKFVVSEGDEVSIYVTDEQLSDFENKVIYNPTNSIESWIIYEDSNILLINKPRGILVQKDGSSEKALDQMVIEYLIYKGEYDPSKEKAFKPGPAHRIDRNTSGIVVFGKTHDTLAYLFELFKTHENIGKHYITLVNGVVEGNGEVNAPLRKNFQQQKVVVAKIKDGGKEARTIYKVLERFNDATLLDVTLVTGRTHQIRVHMSYIRHHVIGDTKYGDFKANNYFEKTYGFKNQFLHASEIHFGELKYPLENLSKRSFMAPLLDEYVKIIEDLRQNNE